MGRNTHAGGKPIQHELKTAVSDEPTDLHELDAWLRTALVERLSAARGASPEPGSFKTARREPGAARTRCG